MQCKLWRGSQLSLLLAERLTEMLLTRFLLRPLHLLSGDTEALAVPNM